MKEAKTKPTTQIEPGQSDASAPVLPENGGGVREMIEEGVKLFRNDVEASRCLDESIRSFLEALKAKLYSSLPEVILIYDELRLKEGQLNGKTRELDELQAKFEELRVRAAELENKVESDFRSTCGDVVDTIDYALSFPDSRLRAKMEVLQATLKKSAFEGKEINITRLRHRIACA